MGNLTDELWADFGQLSIDEIPENVLTVARHCILDWFGCATAGSEEPLSAILREEFREFTGPSSIIGTDLRVTPTTAALVNGTAGHALDYDDTASMGHPSAPLLPAVLALAEEIGASGADVLCAYIAGFEIECRVGALMGRSHYANGWHSTSTIGVFGAATAAARLLEFDVEQFGRAVGLAASQSAGIKANFGTMTKPFHAGFAAERGLLAARLVAKGWTANSSALEANQGLFQAAGDGFSDYTKELMELKERWFLPDTLFKYHAACYLTHSTIECIHGIRESVELGDLEHLTVKVHPAILDVCGLYEQPQTGLEAKFSLIGTAAMALNRLDTSDPRVFCESVVQRLDLQNLMKKVRVATDDTLKPTQAQVELKVRSGKITSAKADSGIPATDLKEQEAKLLSKFRNLTELVEKAKSVQLCDRILGLRELNSIDLLFK